MAFALLALALVIVLLWHAQQHERYAHLATWAAALLIAVALVWPAVADAPRSIRLWSWVATSFAPPLKPVAYMTFLAAASAAVSAVSAWRLWTWQQMPPNTRWHHTGAAIVTPIAVLVIANLRVMQFVPSWSFAAVAVLLAGLLYLVADRFDNVAAEHKSEHTRFGINAFAAACMVSALLAFAMSLSGGYLTLMLAVAATTTALFAVIDKIPSLRALVPLLGIALVVRLAWDPNIQGIGVAPLPVLNWLVVGYGWVGAAFFAAGLILQHEKRDAASDLCKTIGVAGLLLAALFLVRTILTGSDVFGRILRRDTLLLMAIVGVVASVALTRLHWPRSDVPLARSARLIGGGAFLAWLLTTAGL